MIYKITNRMSVVYELPCDALCEHVEMDLIERFGKQFVLDSDYVVPPTTSDLFNRSFFARKWLVYDEPEEGLEDYDEDRWVLRSNDDSSTKWAVEDALVFFDQVTEKESDEWYNCCNYGKTWLTHNKRIRDAHGKKIEEYLRSCKLAEYLGPYKNETDGPLQNYQDKADVICRDWYCFLHYDAEDHTNYWLINVNPQCVLFEYVIFCGTCIAGHLFFHFSEMPEHKHLITHHR